MLAAMRNETMLRRVGGASFVLLLHLIAIGFLLNATVHAIRQASPQREGTIWFVFPPRAKPQPVRIIPAPAPPSRVTRFVIPRNAIATAPAVPNFAMHGDLHALLFDCAPENLANLPPEQRAQCASAAGSAKPPDDEIYAEHSTRSKNATHWARGVARKHEPLLLPCASPQSIFATFSLATVLCLAKAAKEGHFDLDEQPGYGDTPQNVQVPNGGDPPSEPAR